MATSRQMLRLPKVAEMVGTTKGGLRWKVSQGQFPKPVKIGARAVAWPIETVEAWIGERILAAKEAQSCEA